MTLRDRLPLRHSVLYLAALLLMISTAHSAVVINELYYDAPGVDPSFEFIELYNNGTAIVDLTGWQIQWAGTNFTDDTYEIPIGTVIAASDYLLIGGIGTFSYFEVIPDLIYDFNFEDGGTATDAVRIIDPLGYHDTCLYDSPNTNTLEGDASNPAGPAELCPDVADGHSLSRIATGVDNNLATDWEDLAASAPTPSANAIWVPIVKPSGLTSIGAPNWDIFLLNINTAQTIQLTTNEAFDNHPDVSMDGKLVWSSERVGGELQIWTANLFNVEGTAIQRTFEPDYPHRHPHFNHAGTRIIFSSKRVLGKVKRDQCSQPVQPEGFLPNGDPASRYEALTVMNSDGTNAIPLNVLLLPAYPDCVETNVGHPSFSHDDTKIVFGGNPGASGVEWETYTLDWDEASGNYGNLFQVTLGSTYGEGPNPIKMTAGPHFSEDDALIYVSSTRTPMGNAQIFAIPNDGGTYAVRPAYRLTENCANDYVPEALPDGRIAVVSDRDTVNLVCDPCQGEEGPSMDLDVIVMESNGANPINVTDNNAAEEVLLLGDEVSWFCGIKPNLAECTKYPKMIRVEWLVNYMSIVEHPELWPEFQQNAALYAAAFDSGMSIIERNYPIYYAWLQNAMGDSTQYRKWIFWNQCMDEIPAGGTPNVVLDLVPTGSTVIPPGGGLLHYNLTLTNNESTSLPFQYWCIYSLGTIVVPAFGPVSRTAPPGPGYVIFRMLTQTVPGSLAPGAWNYNGYIGAYPGSVWATDNFPFTKSPVGDGGAYYSEGTLTGWEEEEPGVVAATPREFELKGNYPNPFNPVVNLSFSLPEVSQVKLSIYDIQGKLVSTLAEGSFAAGEHSIAFDGTDLPSGIYLARLQAGGYSQVQKLVLMK